MLRSSLTLKKKYSLNQKLSSVFGILSLGLVFGLSIQFARAWTNPTVTPPGGNVAGPINTSATTQTKPGQLNITAGGVWNHGGVIIGGQMLSSEGPWLFVGDAAGGVYGTPTQGLAAGNIWAQNNICLGGDCRSSWLNAGDNLGNHIATQDLNMSGRIINNAYAVYSTILQSQNNGRGDLYLTTQTGSLPGYPTDNYPTVGTSGPNVYFSAAGSYNAAIGNSGIYGRIFRDMDDGSYYVDPNGGTQLANLTIRNSDAVVRTNDTSGRNAELIGTYRGWDANAIYLGGYNSQNHGSMATNKVIVGGSGSALPLYVTGGLSVAAGGAWNHGGVTIGGQSLNSEGPWLYLGDAAGAVYGGQGLAAGKLWANTEICLAGDCRTAWPALSGSYLPLAGGTMNSGATIAGAGRLHISSVENTYILSRGGATIISSAWGGGGSLYVDGDVDVQGTAHFRGRGTDSWFPYINGWNYLRGPTNLAGVLYDEQNNGYYMNLDGTTNAYIVYRYYGYNGAEYDANNGSYYVDPNATSVFNAIQANTFYYPSDETLKKDIVTLPNALESLNAIRGVSFRWKKDDTVSIGVIAQEVEKVYPELVHTDEKGLKAVQYGNLIGPIIEAIKEVNSKVEKLLTADSKQTQELEAQRRVIEEQGQTIERLERTVEALGRL